MATEKRERQFEGLQGFEVTMRPDKRFEHSRSSTGDDMRADELTILTRRRYDRQARLYDRRNAPIERFIFTKLNVRGDQIVVMKR